MGDRMKITELDDDCLEHIFKKLEFIDLIAVADSSKHFKQAVDLVYANKYGKMEIVFQLLKEHGIYQVESSEITVYDLLVSLRLLRCFGHLISELYVHHMQKHQPHLDDYINEYCADTLKKIRLFVAVEEAMGNLIKPFAKCESVYLFAINLESDLVDFNKWFPQMRCLRLIMKHTTIPSCINKHFPNLEDVTIGTILEIPRKVSYIEQNVSNVLRSNQQLKRLAVGDQLCTGFLQSISEHLQRIETLSIDSRGLCGSFDGVVHFQNVQELKLASMHYLPKLPLSFDKLQTLTIYAFEVMLGSNFLEFIRRHRSTLVKLVVRTAEDLDDFGVPFDDIDKKEVAAAMELLIEIDMKDTVFSMDEAIEFLYTCKMLKKFRFKMDKIGDVSKFNDSLKHTGGDWCLSTEDKGVILLER